MTLSRAVKPDCGHGHWAFGTIDWARVGLDPIVEIPSQMIGLELQKKVNLQIKL